MSVPVLAQNHAAGSNLPDSQQPTCTDISGRFPQPCPETPQGNSSPKRTLEFERTLPSSLLRNQLYFWTSPVRMRVSDLSWALPLAALTGGAIAADSRIENHLPDNP